MIDSSFISHATKSKINVFNAVSRLLKHRELDSLTVKEICAEAGIGRSNFYACFSDKYSVLQWYTDLIHCAGAAEIGRTLTWEEGHLITTKGYLTHIDVLNVAGRSKDYNGLGPYSIRRWVDSLKRTVTDYKGTDLTPKLELQIIALSTSATAVAAKCFEDAASYSLEQIVDILISITPPDLYELLKEPAFPNASTAGLGKSELALVEMLTH